MRLRISLISCFILLHYVSFGQTGIRVVSNPVLNVASAADYRNGVSGNNTTLQATATNGQTVSLQVRAAGNLIRGTSSIPITLLYMQVVSTNPVQTERQISTANSTLISGRLSANWTNNPITIKYRLAPSTDLLKPAGAYTTTLTFLFSAQ